ncbi:hypothetical protein SteCoe_14076 [Stentor coeruleus]|uniref:Uncharacterized protein n=1 Tax=Stentor coeruleus TaxID=5963 RepID=A0A1R2C751_9CILI|nr:hypothetical protein SteCoe_14076 [Stentor coeruleus]
MNKYSILKITKSHDFSSEDYFRTFNTTRAFSSASGISTFAINENQQWSRASLSKAISEETNKFPVIHKQSMPTPKDFNTLLYKLDLVTSTKNILNKDTVLGENEQIECVIEEGSYHYIKIPVKSKHSPLRVFMKKSHGKVLVYLSVCNEKPNISNYDQAYNSDFFEFRNLESIFRYENVYLGIRALSFSKFTVSIAFGKNRLQISSEKKFKKIDTLTNEDIDKGQKTSIIKKKKLFKKNYIEQNLQMKKYSHQDILKKSQEWLIKRQIVIRKKKLYLEEKKSKAISFLNKKQLRSAQLELEKQHIESQLMMQNQTKLLISIIYLQKVALQINRIRREKRQQISRKLTMSTKARNIQRAFRKNTRQLTLSQIAILRGLKLISFYHLSTQHLAKISVAKILINTINLAGKAYLPISQFTTFFNKIIKIQNIFRKYLAVKSHRIRKLILFWDQCKSFEVRRSIKKKSKVYELNVSIYQRQAILNKHYMECVEKCYNKIRETPLSFFISEVNTDKLIKRKKITFDFMPSVQRMKRIFEEALLIPDRES